MRSRPRQTTQPDPEPPTSLDSRERRRADDTRQKAAVSAVTEFGPPYDAETLRVLQGQACIDCKTMCSPLYPAGQAVCIGPSGDRITWAVGRCAECGRRQG